MGSSSPTPPTTGGSGSSSQAVGDEIAHFKSIPWCANHLSRGNLIITPVFSRKPKPNFDDALFSTTLNTHDTIPAFICFYPGPEDRRAYLPQLQALVSLGNQIAGYGGVAHGGIVATVFDELLSLLAPAARWEGWWRGEEGLVGVVTAYLHTRYVRKVTVPGTYLVTVRLVRKEGRKVFVEGKMEDEKGVTVASAEALFIEAMAKL